MMRDDIPGESYSQMQEPPSSPDAEQRVLGAVLTSSDALDRVEERLALEDFYVGAHRTIYKEARALILAGKPADAVSVAEALTSAELAAVGGLAYIGGLAMASSGSANVEHFADLVRDRSIRRRLIVFGNDAAEAAYLRDGRPSADLLHDLQAKLSDIETATDGTDEPVKVGAMIGAVMHAIEERAERHEPITGIRTGVGALDEKILGLHGGELVVIAGRPGMGKTTLAMQIAHVATQGSAAREPVPAAVWSLEMKASALVEHALSHIGLVDSWRVRSGTLGPDDFAKLAHAHGRLSDAPLYIDPHPSVKVERIAARARRIKRRHGLGLIVIDYLQLIEGGQGDNRNEQVGYISRTLKKLATELDVPVVVLSQLNRGLESRPNKRPNIGDLRDSGAIEADADVVIFCYRDELYHPNDDNKGRAELIVGKQREGEVGPVYADFVAHTRRFADTDWRPTYGNTGTKRRATADDE